MLFPGGAMDSSKIPVAELGPFLLAFMKANGINEIRLGNATSYQSIALDHTRQEELLTHKGAYRSDYDGVAHIHVIRKGFTDSVEYTVTAQPKPKPLCCCDNSDCRGGCS